MKKTIFLYLFVTLPTIFITTTPRKKMNYTQKEVAYTNQKDNITISATLTIPKTDHKAPVAILISGVGPQDRDYTMLGHKLFVTISDHLIKNGIATLRFDKRGVGKSTGTCDTTVTTEDLANDVLAAVTYLKTREDIDTKQIGLIGHSEGGAIASMVATQSEDVSFIVLMAGAVATSIDTNVEHVAMQLKADGASDELIALDKTTRRKILETVTQEKDAEIANKKLHAIAEEYLQTLTEEQKAEAKKLTFAITEDNYTHVIDLFNSPWYRCYLSFDFAKILENISIPVLALNGDHDWITASDITLPIIQSSLEKANNKNYTIKKLPALNHWLQTCKTGAMPEYGQTKETIAPIALQTISDWIMKVTNK